MGQGLTLANLLDDAVILSFEHQLHLEEVLGEHAWSIDLDEPRFEFTGTRPITCTRFHVLGSAALDPRSWLWAWANPSGFAEQLVALSATVREFGQRYGLAELTSAEVPFGALPGAPAEPVFVAGVLTEAAKAVTGQWASYNADAGGGTRIAFLIEHPDFRLPPPDPARVMRVIQQAIAELPITDHRRAMHSYAIRRGLGATFSPDYASLTLTAPGLWATATFDEYNRLSDLRASMP